MARNLKPLADAVIRLTVVSFMAVVILACQSDAEVTQASSVDGGGSPRLVFAAGAFLFDSRYEVDLDARKHKYPLVSDDFLLFLEVGGEGYRLYAYPLSDALSSGPWLKAPALVYPEENADAGLFAGPAATVRAFFRGPAFLEITGEGTPVLRQCPSGRALSSGAPVRDYLGRVEALVGPDGLEVGDRPAFTCKEVFAFDEHDGVFAVSYQDLEGRQRVCLVSGRGAKNCDCGPLSDRAEFGPRFSQDGRWLAVAAKEGQRWDLHVYAVNGGEAKGPVATVADIAFYDVTTEDFVYPGSFEWVGSTLYFVGRHSARERALQRLGCKGGRCTSPELVETPACVQIAPYAGSGLAEDSKGVSWAPATAGCSETDPLTGQLEVREIVWAQPFVHEGVVYLAAESVVRPRHAAAAHLSGRLRWLSRILVFRVGGDGP